MPNLTKEELKALEEQKALEITDKELKLALQQIKVELDNSVGKYGTEVDKFLTEYLYLGKITGVDDVEKYLSDNAPETLRNLLEDRDKLSKEVYHQHSRDNDYKDYLERYPDNDDPGEEYRRPRENFDELNASLEKIVNKYVKTEEKMTLVERVQYNRKYKPNLTWEGLNAVKEQRVKEKSERQGAVERQKALEVSKEKLQSAQEQIEVELDNFVGKYGTEADDLFTRRKYLIEEIRNGRKETKIKDLDEYIPDNPDYLRDELYYDIEVKLRETIPEIHSLLADAERIDEELHYRWLRDENSLPNRQFREPRKNFDEINASLEGIVSKHVKTQENAIPIEQTKESPLPASENVKTEEKTTPTERAKREYMEKSGMSEGGLKPYDKYVSPKESFREIIGEKNLEKMGKDDLERIDKSIDKRMSQNNPPTVAEIKNLALRATAKIEENAGRKAFMEQTKENIAKFVEENPGTGFSKRQYSDIMKRAEKSMSPIEVRMDLYKVSQVNNLTNSFMEQMKDSGISVSRRFEDLLAQNIERGRVSMANVQNIMDKTIERVQSQEFKIDKKVRENETFKADSIVDYYVDGKRAGSVVELEDKNGVGEIIAYLDAKSESKSIFSIHKLEEDALYQTDKGEKMSREQAAAMAEKSVVNAINTVRLMDAFKHETFVYADTFGKNRLQEETKSADSPKVEQETQKEHGGIEL